jgi:elongation factor G
VREAMRAGTVAGYPIQDVKVTLFDGQHHSVDSSEMAFKMAGSMAFKDAMEQAQADADGADHDRDGHGARGVRGRRDRRPELAPRPPLGMEPKGSVTEIKAEVPMAEMLDYAPDLRAITGGRASTRWTSPGTRRCPGHVAQQVVQQAQQEKEAVKA